MAIPITEFTEEDMAPAWCGWNVSRCTRVYDLRKLEECLKNKFPDASEKEILRGLAIFTHATLDQYIYLSPLEYVD